MRTTSHMAASNVEHGCQIPHSSCPASCWLDCVLFATSDCANVLVRLRLAFKRSFISNKGSLVAPTGAERGTLSVQEQGASGNSLISVVALLSEHLMAICLFDRFINKALMMTQPRGKRRLFWSRLMGISIGPRHCLALVFQQSTLFARAVIEITWKSISGSLHFFHGCEAMLHVLIIDNGEDLLKQALVESGIFLILKSWWISSSNPQVFSASMHPPFSLFYDKANTPFAKPCFPHSLGDVKVTRTPLRAIY